MQTSPLDCPRVFAHVKDGRQLLVDLESPRGAFLKTRAPIPLGQGALAVVKIPEADAPLEIPILVTGRRVRRDANKTLTPGIVARLTDEHCPAVQLLRELASGRPAEGHAARAPRRPVTSVFASLDDLRRQLQALMLERPGQFVVDTPVHVGEALLLTCVVPTSMLALSFTVRVRGVSYYEHDFGVRAELLDPEYRARVDAFLRRTAWTDASGGGRSG